MLTISSCLIWQIISFILPPNEYGCVYTSLSGPAIDLQKILSDEDHLDPGGYLNKQNCHIWDTENPHAYIEMPTHPKRVTVWCGFWSRGIMGHFSSQISKERPLQPMAIGPCWTNFCAQKLKRRILATFGFNWTALRATQPKLHSIFASCFTRSHYQ